MRFAKEIPVVTDIEDQDPPPEYWYNHILYLGDGFAVCHRPKNLGTDFIIQDTKPGRKQCAICFELVLNHNERLELVK